MSPMPKTSHSKTVWGERSIVTAPDFYYAFVPSKKAWKKTLKTLGVPPEEYPKTSGRCTSYTTPKGVICLVTMREDYDKKNKECAIGLLAHEAMHVWRLLRKHIGEDDPSMEFEAYSFQTIFQSLLVAWKEARKVKL